MRFFLWSFFLLLLFFNFWRTWVLFVGPLIPLYFWWCLLWVSKPEWVLLYSSLAEAYVLRYTFPEIHLWCDTCWPLASQHGSQAVYSTYLWCIGGTRNRELSCCRSQCEIRQTLYRLSYPSSGSLSLLNMNIKLEFLLTHLEAMSLLLLLKYKRTLRGH